MRQCFAIFIALLMLLAGSAQATLQDALKLLKEGDAVYEKRAFNLPTIHEAIVLWKKSSALDRKSQVPHLRIALAYCYLARFETRLGRMEPYYRQAHEYAQLALENDGKSALAHYLWAYSAAMSVQNKSKFAKLSLLGDVTMHLKTAQALDPTCHYGGPDRMLGMLALKSPISNTRIALNHLQKSLKYAPDYSENLLLLAEARIKLKQPDQARKALDRLLALQPKPGFEQELADDKKKATALLENLAK